MKSRNETDSVERGEVLSFTRNFCMRQEFFCERGIIYIEWVYFQVPLQHTQA